MVSMGANLLSMIGGRAPPRTSPSSSFTSQSSGSSGGKCKYAESDQVGARQAAEGSVSSGLAASSGGMSSMFSGISTGWSNWGGRKTNTPNKGAAAAASTQHQQRQQGGAPQQITKYISWGILGEVHMQILIRHDICGRDDEKIGKMYNWLAHVLDGQPLALLPSKGLELKGIKMRTCGLFLDCVVPFLNESCHPGGKITAQWLIAANGGRASPRLQEWRHAKTWIVNPTEGVSTGRARSWTVEALLGSTAAKEGGYVDWRSRFGLQPGQELGSVHIRLHMVPSSQPEDATGFSPWKNKRKM